MCHGKCLFLWLDQFEISKFFFIKKSCTMESSHTLKAEQEFQLAFIVQGTVDRFCFECHVM